MADRADYKREWKRKRRGSYCLFCRLLIHHEDDSYRCAYDGSLKERMQPACRHRVKGYMRSQRAYYQEKMREKAKEARA